QVDRAGNQEERLAGAVAALEHHARRRQFDDLNLSADITDMGFGKAIERDEMRQAFLIDGVITHERSLCAKKITAAASIVVPSCGHARGRGGTERELWQRSFTLSQNGGTDQ